MTTIEQPGDTKLQKQFIGNLAPTLAWFMAFGVNNNKNNSDVSFRLCGAQLGHLLPLNLQTNPHVKKTGTKYNQCSVPYEDEAMTGHLRTSVEQFKWTKCSDPK